MRTATKPDYYVCSQKNEGCTKKDFTGKPHKVAQVDQDA